VLSRRDIASMVASWFVARKYDSFTLGSRQVVRSIHFGEDSEEDVRGNLRRVLRNMEMIERVEGAIRVDYEDLCADSFKSQELESFFGREIRLANPRGPTDARQYVENWHEFSAFIDGEMRRYRAPDTRIEIAHPGVLPA
jgi:hypothetical protein